MRIDEHMRTWSHRAGDLKNLGLTLMPLLALSALPLLVPTPWGDYTRLLFFSILLYVTMAVSYDLVGGLLGYLYLGHGLFFGLGTYLTALVLKGNHPLLLALLLATCLILPTAALVSLPLFRLRGGVFALATLGLLFLGGHIANNLPKWTGGAAGLSLPPNPDPMLTYYLSLVLALAAVIVHWLICNSRLGLMIASIQESEGIAESVGINSGKVKRLVLVVSAVPAALAGGLYAREMSFVVPGEAFGLENSLAPLLMCLLFKPGTTRGPLLGAFILSTAQEIIWTTAPGFRSSLYGILLIFIGTQRARRTQKTAGTR